ncbi:glycosyltransferase family A protein [Planktothrix sp. FACHB-1365]|uniref:glycosyltransferase family A protein n=1 Tax=Planktothrix sp. FACHB-1365 TaxID=2692855 RepID=UPI001688BB1A|nr:glycosyltransferase family A protein [Planktothrix sp. FACHB-1365]MBD2482910.1 glycosyltransferase family 2 protein [Planktothrix sp. FACHB-1365]
MTSFNISTAEPLLSIVTATLGKFSDYWLEQLLKVKGNVEFILVYPPNTPIPNFPDPRIRVIISPFKGEVMQRMTGLLNVNTEYVIALDDDDFIHPDILELTSNYFARFPESWVLRLAIKNIDYQDEAEIQKEWSAIPNIDQLEVISKTPENPYPYQKGNYKDLLAIPIVPLNNKLDILLLINQKRTRKDREGIHFENFNNKVWKTVQVKESLEDFSQTLKLMNALTWIPSWSLDRTLGLFIQAKFYEPEKIMGHALPKPEQIRYILMQKKGFRIYLSSDILLIKRFPQYAYLWNLIFSQLDQIPRFLFSRLKSILQK